MPAICLYFQVHQPFRLRRYTYFDIGRVHAYDDEEQNRLLLDKVATQCYLPANACLGRLIDRHAGRFRLAFSLTGVFLDQLEAYRPDVLESFRRLADTGCVEFLGETYYHSLAYLYSRNEFKEQVIKHREKTESLFGKRPVTFRHTELLYSNDLANTIEEMGFEVILAEGAEKILGMRSPNVVYRPATCERLRLLLRNFRLSDDIAFRFSDRSGVDSPLTVETFARRIHAMDGHDTVGNLFMDYETFGEHQWRETGIFDFLEHLPAELFKRPAWSFITPAQAVNLEPVGDLDVPETISWADTDRGVSAWLGNAMQRDAASSLYVLEEKVRRLGHADLLESWRRLQTSDHFYYMCTKWCADGDIHKYFNPYASPYDAYINYMNVLDDFSRQIKKECKA